MAKLLVALVAAAMLCGCAKMDVRTMGAIDKADKTISVPPGGGFLGTIKDALASSGWKVYTSVGSTQSRSLGPRTASVAVSGERKGRYILTAASEQVDLCLDFTPLIRFDISIIDADNGVEVVTATGVDCEDHVAKKFKEKAPQIFE